MFHQQENPVQSRTVTTSEPPPSRSWQVHSTVVAEEVNGLHDRPQPRSDLSKATDDQSQAVTPPSSSGLALKVMEIVSELTARPLCDNEPQTVLPPSMPLFALVIGIDEYTDSDCGQLHGAVYDAITMRDYLEKTLRVPGDHIRALFNSEATRDGIIEAFRSIRDDQRIKEDDPIVVFYAGHGGELPAQHGWGVGGKIQCLIPSDYKPGAIYPIPDRTIGALVDEIADAKGDNITLIFDCCYSAGCTRDEDKEYIPRTVHLEPYIPETLDNDILASREGSFPVSFAHHGVRSHILLAACGYNELAYEHNGHGQFTDAVLRTLATCAVDKVTYADLIERIHLPKQHPQCEGLNRHRVLFDGRVSTAKQIYHITQDGQDGLKYVINAGLAHGVSPGVEFTLSNDHVPRLGTIAVNFDDTVRIGDFETIVTVLRADLKAASFAKLTRVGKVPVYLARGENASVILEQTLQAGSGTDDPNFRLVEEVEEAKLEVTMENDVVIFRILDERLRRFGLDRLPRGATLDSVRSVLAAAAHYYWYLGLTNKDDRIGSIHREVVVDFYPLSKTYDKDGWPLYTPITDHQGFRRQDPHSEGSDLIEFVVERQTRYGVKITNNTQYNLYLNAFLFNSSSLSIAPYYTQSGVGTPEAPLKQNGSFTIGYGPGGTPPFTYWLADNQNVDVGILKIFFATKPVDLSDVVQKSPFAQVANGRQRNTPMDPDGRGAKLSVSIQSDKRPPSRPVDTWFTVEIPIVQRRFAA